MSKHTPGPWKVNRGRHGTLGMTESEMKPFTFIQTDFHASGKIKNGPEAAICEMRTGERAIGVGNGTFHHHITDEEVQFNAQLIAAAPDLLTACMAFIAAFESGAYDPYELVQALQDHDIVSDMQAAIAKAVTS